VNVIGISKDRKTYAIFRHLNALNDVTQRLKKHFEQLKKTILKNLENVFKTSIMVIKSYDPS